MFLDAAWKRSGFSTTTTRVVRCFLAALLSGLGIGAGCTPAPDPGALGGVCVDTDLCDFGLVCVDGLCRRGGTAGDGQPGAVSSPDAAVSEGIGGASGGVAGLGSGGTTGGSGFAAGGSSPTGAAGSGSAAGGRNGGSAGSSGGTSSSSGGSAGSAGSSGSAGSTGGQTCVGIPSVNGRCNRNACLCPTTDECFPRASASNCCSVAPTCG